MSLLSDDDIDGMRTVVTLALPDTAVIEAPVYHSDGGGGGTTDWTPQGTVACRMSPPRPTTFGTEQEIANRVSPEAKWVITMPALTNIDTTMRVVVGSNTYEIVEVQAPRSWELATRAQADLVT